VIIPALLVPCGCRVECRFNRLKQNLRVATRYEKRAANYLVMPRKKWVRAKLKGVFVLHVVA
jgi:transposase